MAVVFTMIARAMSSAYLRSVISTLISWYLGMLLVSAEKRGGDKLQPWGSAVSKTNVLDLKLFKSTCYGLSCQKLLICKRWTCRSGRWWSRGFCVSVQSPDVSWQCLKVLTPASSTLCRALYTTGVDTTWRAVFVSHTLFCPYIYTILISRALVWSLSCAFHAPFCGWGSLWRAEIPKMSKIAWWEPHLTEWSGTANEPVRAMGLVCSLFLRCLSILRIGNSVLGRSGWLVYYSCWTGWWSCWAGMRRRRSPSSQSLQVWWLGPLSCHATFALPDVSFFSTLFFKLILAILTFLLPLAHRGLVSM